jgi:hypothetical protein
MGYFYDWVNNRWADKAGLEGHPRRKPAHETLLPELMKEIEPGSSETSLYAGLLARAIVVQDCGLMREYGKQVARLTGEKVPPGV